MKKKQNNSGRASAFIKIALSVALISISAILLASSFKAAPSGASSQQQGSQTNNHGTIVVHSYHNDVSPPLRDIQPRPVQLKLQCELKENPKIPNNHIDSPDTAVQDPVASLRSLQQSNIPATTLNFDGILYPGVNCFCAPPDPNGAVGLTQYVAEVNDAIQVFDKTNGNSLLGPIATSTLWTGFGGVCEFNGNGDGILLYDHIANRWIVSQFAGVSTDTDECIAVSTSSDATGSYNRYGFHLGSNFFDYPKIAVWPDAYYMSMNIFNPSTSAYMGPQPFAFDRANMLLGNPATFITTGITNGSTENPYLPSDLDGSTMPPAGAPNSFVEWPGNGTYKIYHFHADFGTPANSTFTLFASPAAAAFTQLCPNTRACVPQSGVTTASSGLDGIGDRLMFRAAYRNFGDHESLVTNYTVSSSGVAGVRWIELRNVTNGPVTVFQESTYQPDTTWRWMGSVAMDNAGDLAVGFSASSSTINPQIRYAGRLAGDPLNTLAQGEATLFAGAGSQSGTGDRWGDYSAMSVDPVDDCTFWYTNEYYSTTSAFNWRTRIGNFAFSQCTPQPPPPPAPAVSIFKTADAASVIPGAQIGFTITVKNTGAAAATGLSVSDNLPAGNDINWSIDGVNTDPGWLITGLPPNQTLTYSPTTLASSTSVKAHVVSSTTTSSCGKYTNTAFLAASSSGGSATASTTVDCSNCSSNPWTLQTAVPANIMDQAVGSIGSNVYMFSGISNGAFTNTARKYDSIANTWTSITNFPASVEVPVAASDGTRFIYIMGGYNGSAAQTTTTRYDTVGNAYLTEASFTTSRWAAGAAYINGKVYLMGGFNSAGSAAQTSLQIYTVATNTWGAGAAMPIGLAFPQATAMTVGGNSYVFAAGGTTPSTAQNKTYRYDIAGNTWTAVADMPSTRWGGASGIVNGLWVLAGGYVNGNPSTSAVAYDPNADTWTLLNSNMVNPRGRGAGASTGTALFHIGGRNDTTFNGTTDNQRYLPIACPILNKVVSRATHGSAGTFDIDLTSGNGIECRALDTSGDYMLVLTFSNTLSSVGGASVTSGTGSVSGGNIDSNDKHNYILNLTGVTNAQVITVSLSNVSDSAGDFSSSIPASMAVLVGDTNGDGFVNSADISQTKSQSGQTVGGSNFREDVNTDGFLNSADISLVKSKSGTALP
jgi:uncharacterized repeat protein (TIGR01451 family)